MRWLLNPNFLWIPVKEFNSKLFDEKFEEMYTVRISLIYAESIAIFLTDTQEITRETLLEHIPISALPAWLGGTIREEMADIFSSTQCELLLNDRETLKEALFTRCRRSPPFGINFST